MTLQDFHKHSTARLAIEGDWLLSDLERHLSKMFRVVEIGKRGRSVPVILSNDATLWLDALVSNRYEAGVARHNFLFVQCYYGGTGHI